MKDKIIILLTLFLGTCSSRIFAGTSDSMRLTFATPDNHWYADHYGSNQGGMFAMKKRTLSTSLIVGGALLTGLGASLLIAGGIQSERAGSFNPGLSGLGKQVAGVVIGVGGLAMLIGGVSYRHKALHRASAE